VSRLSATGRIIANERLLFSDREHSLRSFNPTRIGLMREASAAPMRILRSKETPPTRKLAGPFGPVDTTGSDD